MSDKPVYDDGKNFDRIARIGLLDEYVNSFNQVDLLGIDIKAWRTFLKTKVNLVE